MGRAAGGVYGMDLAKGDYLVEWSPCNRLRNYQEGIEAGHGRTSTSSRMRQSSNPLTSLMLTVSEKSFGKRTPLAEYASRHAAARA